MISGFYPIFSHWIDKGTIWIYSDTHFSDPDQKLIDSNWPSDKAHLSLINSKVGKTDTLILLGDIGNLDYARRIKGYKVLIKGNHDSGSKKYREIFNEVYEGPILAGPQILFSHEQVFLPFAFNFHGHDHANKESSKFHLNCCANVLNYQPLNLNQFFKKQSPLASIPSIHRITINKATNRLS
jgi:calcineurin-like phosphoesterase family protein